jgi:DNA-binding NtrC family response regulator
MNIPAGEGLDVMLASYERELISKLLEQNRFSLNRTADRLKISRHALRYRMQRLNISAGSDADEGSFDPDRDSQ